MVIKKKIWPESFQAILDGKKKYELRLADWSCSPGDILVLAEWDPATTAYTGRVLEKTVTYVGRTMDVPYWPKEEIEKYGFQIISFS